MIASFAAALAALANGRPFLSGAVRAVDVDASEFEGCFACTGFIIEVDLDHAIAYWHTPNAAGEINPDEAALSRAQVAAARQILAEDAA